MYKVHMEALEKLKHLNGVHIIDPIAYLCSDGLCSTRDEERVFFYRDNNHMRPWYSKKYNSYLNGIFIRKSNLVNAVTQQGYLNESK